MSWRGARGFRMSSPGARGVNREVLTQAGAGGRGFSYSRRAGARRSGCILPENILKFPG
jgi:hypothetical protein